MLDIYCLPGRARYRGVLFIGTAMLLVGSPGRSAENAPWSERPFPDVKLYEPIKLPRHFRSPEARAFDNTPADNPTTPAGVALGRVLFYDTRLSVDNTISCGSCHRQQHGFTDPRRHSPGVDGVQGDRNAMSLINLRFIRQGFFWDERADSLEAAVLKPIEDPAEMNNSIEAVVERISRDENYAPLFKKAFGDKKVNSKRIARALAQFVRSIVSCRSSYDEGIAKAGDIEKEFPNYTKQENRGKDLFLENCAICHHPRGGQQAFFTMFTSLNNGIDPGIRVPDAGQGAVNFLPADLGSFRAPPLRNVARTAPYMHDGRFSTLVEVINHYSDGVKQHPNTSGFAFRMQFSTAEKDAIIAFLHTLTDTALLNDPRYSNPWTDQPRIYDSAKLVAVIARKPDRDRQQDSEAVLSRISALDENSDGRWDDEELAPLRRRLCKAAFPTRLARFGPEADPVRETRGDRNPEVSRAQAVERDLSELFRLNDLGRDLSRLNRFVDRLDLETVDRDAVWHRIQEARLDHFADIARLVEGTTREVNEIFSSKQLTQFQAAMVNERGRPSGRDRRINTNSEAEAFLDMFDADQNHSLDFSEVSELAIVIGRLPDGLDSPPPSRPLIQDLAARHFVRDDNNDQQLSRRELPPRIAATLMPSDANGDHFLSRAEVESYVVQTAYSKFLEDGVYVGGGFENAYSIAGEALESCDLAEARYEVLSRCFEDHELAVLALRRDAVDAQLRWLIGQGHFEVTTSEPERRDAGSALP